MIPADSETEYAFWTAPGTSLTVTYSLSVFHEIDFQVSEGYRRIPHGGIETGGILFGKRESGSVRMEAFRPIECEHASGPSFVLSERDLERLKQQLSAAETDPELAGLEAVGWFVAHTRSPLRMNERESALFEELFPGAGKVMLLIKPERFQPTRFGFLVRGEDGRVPQDATEQAIILPLPGRAGRTTNAPKPSIPAPEEKPAPVVASPVPSLTESTVTAPVVPVLEQRPQAHATTRPIELPAEPKPAAPTKERPAFMPAPERPREAPREPATALPSIEEIKRRRLESIQQAERFESHPPPPVQQRTSPNLRLSLVLLLAAALGCGVGYWAYLQLPSPTIALHVKPQPYSLLISWPSEQTRDAVFAAIRVDDGQQIPLSAEERISGQARIPRTGDNVKVELISQHWLRDSRGIVRYVKPLPQETQPATANPGQGTPPIQQQ